MPNIYDEIDPDVSQPVAASPAEKNPYDFIDPNPAPEKSTVAGSFAGGVARKVAPMAAFMAVAPTAAAAGAEAGSVLGPPGALAGSIIAPIVAGSIAAWGAHKAQTAAADAIAPNSVFGSKMERQQAEEHPLASELGGMAVIGKPNPMNVWKAAKTLLSDEGRNALMLLAQKGPQAVEEIPKYLQKEVENFHNVALGGGINAAFNAYDQVQSGNYSASDLGKAAAEGLLFNMPWIHARNPSMKYLKDIGLAGVGAQDALAEGVRLARDKGRGRTLENPRMSLNAPYEFFDPADFRPDDTLPPDAGAGSPVAPVPPPAPPVGRMRVELPKPPAAIVPNANQNQVNETGAIPPVELVPPVVQAADEAQGGVAQPKGADQASAQLTPAQRIVPAVRSGGATAVGEQGDTHRDILTKRNMPEGSERGFWLDGKWLSRSEAAKITGLETKLEPGQLHSEDLPGYKAKQPEPAAPPAEDFPLPKLNWLDDKGVPLMQPHLSGVKIKQADGTIVDAQFNGYYTPEKPSIGYVLPDGRITHTPLRKGDEVISPIPSPEEWAAVKEAGAPKSEKKNAAPLSGKIKNESVESGRTGEDLELKPEFASKFRSVAMLQGGKVVEAKPGEFNHAAIAERLGFPKDLIPGFINHDGDFVYQHEEDVPKENKLSIPPTELNVTPPAVKSGANISEYTLLDAVKEHGRLGGPNMDDAMNQMAAGKSAKQIAAEYGDQYAGLQDVLETAFQQRTRKNAVGYNRLKKAYELAGLGGGTKQIDTTHEGMTTAFQQGQGYPGGLPKDQGELIARAWSEAQDRIMNKPVSEKAAAKAEAERLAALAETDANWKYWNKRNDPKKSEPLPLGNLEKGTTYTLNKKKMRVMDVEIDEDGRTVSLELEGEYGRQRWTAEDPTPLRMDNGSLKQSESNTDLLPPEDAVVPAEKPKYKPGFQPPEDIRLANGKGLDEAQKKVEWDRYMADFARYKAEMEAWDASMPQNEGLVFKRDNGNYHAITRDPNGGWRISFFGKIFTNHDGIAPTGHDLFKTRLEAIKAERPTPGNRVADLPEILSEPEVKAIREANIAADKKAEPIPTTEQVDASKEKTAAAAQPVVEQPAANLPPSVQKYNMLGDINPKTGERKFSPQTWSLVERIGQTAAEKEAGDPPLVKIKNDRTGETQTVEEQQLRKVKQQTPEQRVKNKGTKLSERERLIAELGTYGFKSLKERTIEELRAMVERARAGKKFAAGEFNEDYLDEVSRRKQAENLDQWIRTGRTSLQSTAQSGGQSGGSESGLPTRRPSSKVGTLKPGDRIFFNSKLVEVTGITPEPLDKFRVKLSVKLVSNPEKYGSVGLDKRDPISFLAKYASGESGQIGLSVDEATQAIHEALGTSGELPHGITVIRDEEATWGARIDDRNKITVNAAQISNSARAQQVILEEGLHGVWESDAVQRAWRDIRKSVNLVDMADARQERARLGLPSDPETIREEAAIAKLLKRQANRNLVTKLLDAVRASIKKNFGINIPGTNRQMLIDAATDFLKSRRESLPGKRFVADNGIVLAPGMSPMYAITAFHGTPHRVKKFSTEKIGTGEGAQVYGWGLYFAENQKVGDEYRKSLTNRNTPSRENLEQFYKKGNLVPSYGGGTDHVLGFEWNDGNWIVKVQEVRKLPNGTLEEIGRPRTHRTSPSPRELEKAGITPGAVYTVSIKAEPHEFLDFDKNLSEQSPKVQEALREYAAKNKRELDDAMTRGESMGRGEYEFRIDPSGQRIYDDLKAENQVLLNFGTGSTVWGGHAGSQRAASEHLASLGIKGVRYLDQGSRVQIREPKFSGDAWEAIKDGKVVARDHDKTRFEDAVSKLQTHNYVIFNDADISITHENGVRVETADAVNHPTAEGVRFAAGEFDFGDTSNPEKPVVAKNATPADEDKARRISAISRELNDLQEKEKRTPADNARIVALEKELGQMDLPLDTGADAKASQGVNTPFQMAIQAGQGKRLVGSDIRTQGDIFGEKPKGQQSFFAAGDAPATDKPEPQVPGDVAGVRKVGQLDIKESIPNAQRRLRTGFFDGTQPVEQGRTREAFRIAGLFTDAEQKDAFMREVASNAAPEGEVREIAPALLVAELRRYAMRMAIEGDDSLLRTMVNRSRDFAVVVGTGQSAGARALRGLGEGGGLFKLWNIIATRRAEQEGRRLGIGWKKYEQLIDALNNSNLSEEAWNSLLTDTPMPDGRTIGDVLDQLPGRQSNTTRQQLELEREIIGWKDKNNLEAARWMNKLEDLQTEWIRKPEAKKNPVREAIKEALDDMATNARLVEDPTDFKQSLREKLEALDVLPNVARRLADAIWQKGMTDWGNLRTKAMARAAKGGVASLFEAIRNSPQFLQTDPYWIKETTENWLMSNGLSRDQATAISGSLLKEFQAKLQTAREVIAKRIIDRGPPKSLEDIIAAIRAGLTNPDQQWSDILAKRNGWLPLTREQNQKLAILESQYSNPGMTPHERVAIQEQMNGIFRHSNLHDHGLIQVIAESQAASLLSGVRTSTLHIFQPLVAILKDIPTHTIGVKTLTGQSDFISMSKALLNALKTWKPEFAEAWQKDAYSFSEHQTGFFHNELKRQYEIGQKEIQSPNAKLKAKGVLRIIFGTQQFVVRALQSANQAGMAVTREWKLALYTSKIIREAGLGQADVSQMVDAVARGKESAYEMGKLMGLEDRAARVRANDMYDEALELFFANKSLDGSKLKEAVDAANKDAFSSVGRRAPGIGEFDEGMVSRYTVSKLIKIVSDLRKEGGAGSIAAVMGAGFINIPFRMTRYLAGFSPYGFLRYGIHKWRLNRGKETFWKQSFANDLQTQARLRDAVVGTALMSMFVGWQYGHHTSDDNSGKKGFWIYATGDGPKSRVQRDNWEKEGFKPLSLNIVMNGKVAGSFPITRVGEILMAPLGLAAALDDLAWKRKEAEATGHPSKTGLAAAAEIPWEAISTYWDLMATKGIFQTATHITQMGSGGGSGNTELMLAKSASSAVSPIILPFRQLLSNISDWMVGPLDRSSVEAATAANFPVVGLPWASKSINRFGDQLYDQSWTGKLQRLGLPFMMHTAQTPENEALYGMQIEKGAAPPELRRSLLEDRYGPLTDEQYSQFAKISGKLIKSATLSNLADLQVMGAEDVKSFFNKTATTADNQAATDLGLERARTLRNASEHLAGVGTPSAAVGGSQASNPFAGARNSPAPRLSPGRPAAAARPARVGVTRLKAAKGFSTGKKKRIGPARLSVGRSKRPRRLKLPKNLRA